MRWVASTLISSRRTKALSRSLFARARFRTEGGPTPAATERPRPPPRIAVHPDRHERSTREAGGDPHASRLTSTPNASGASRIRRTTFIASRLMLIIFISLCSRLPVARVGQRNLRTYEWDFSVQSVGFETPMPPIR